MINTKAYREILSEETSVLNWLNSSMCYGQKRDIAFKELDRIRRRRVAYENAVKRNRKG